MLRLTSKDRQRLESRRRLLTRMALFPPLKHPRCVSLSITWLSLGVGRDVRSERRRHGIRQCFLRHHFVIGLPGGLIQGIREEQVLRAGFCRDDDLALALVCAAVAVSYESCRIGDLCLTHTKHRPS